MLVDVTLRNNPLADMISKVNGNKTSIKRYAKGIYEIGHFSLDVNFPFSLTFEEHWPELNESNYGVCDHIDQILEKYPELQDENRRFCVSITPILKKNQPKNGGWRWHKWGPYIGNYEIKHEYLYDEDIDGVLVYHIYEFNKERIL